MKTEDLKNLSLQEIVEALQTQNLLKQDFVVPSKYIKMLQSNLIVLNESKLDSLSKLLWSELSDSKLLSYRYTED